MARERSTRMKKNAFIGLAHIFLLCVLVMGCTHTQRNDEASGMSGLENHDMQSLIDREWVLESIDSDGTAGAENNITLVFGEEGRLHGSAGCNRYSGSFSSQTQNLLTIGPIAATRMMCPDEVMNSEVRYLKALEAVSSYNMTNRNLMLSYDGDGKVLSFIEKDLH